MGAPMLLDDEVVGVLSSGAPRSIPFDERAMALLAAFAVQAAIAVTDVELVRALEARSAELASKVDSSRRSARSARRSARASTSTRCSRRSSRTRSELSGTDGGSIMEYDERRAQLPVRSAYGTSPSCSSGCARSRIELDEHAGRPRRAEGHPLRCPTSTRSSSTRTCESCYDDGWRSVLAVPMLREDRIVGALVVRRRTTGRVPATRPASCCRLRQPVGAGHLNAQLFRELETQAAELEVASRHKSEFLASMSHELRTPLNAVIGFSEVLLERMFGDLNERQDEYLRDIRSSGKHLLELLNEILDLSKVEAGQMELELDAVPGAAPL